jgi:ribonucleotide monophosphatase NagD (HAD superfamily)
MQRLRNMKGFISDMDGVIYHGADILPGAQGSRNNNSPFLNADPSRLAALLVA